MPAPSTAFEVLARRIRACVLCARELPHPPRPVFRMAPTSRLLIVGQAPGRRVHATGVPFDDPSGDRLRDWLGVGRDVFYDASRVALVPMGFCYPGTGRSGDLPPRPECAATWREEILGHLRAVSLTVLVGRYAVAWHLRERARPTLAETVRAWREFQPDLWPLPHPSPRNNLWLRRNPWLEREIIPELRRRVARVLDCPPASSPAADCSKP